MDSLLRYELDNKMVQNILKANGFKARRSRNSERVTVEHLQTLKSKAVKILKGWKESGVPVKIFDTLIVLDERVINKFDLSATTGNQQPNTARVEHTSTDWVAFEQVIFPDSDVPLEPESLSTSTESPTSSGTEEDDVDVSPVQFLRNAKFAGKQYTLKRLLQHFAVATDQTYDNMTILLSLLKEHQPHPCYESLPRTGEGLLSMKSFELPIAKEVKDVKKQNVIGKYVHFGIESALCGNSPGSYFRYADVIQYAAIYATNPEIIHGEILEKIVAFDAELKLKEALNILRGEKTTLTSNKSLPHFKLDANIDGVAVFKCSEQGEVIPILCSTHSISKSASDEDKCSEIIFETRYPFVAGFFHGKTKPEADDLVAEFVAELERLRPDNSGPETIGRKCTVALHCMKCDTPIRGHLKKCKVSGYWSCERCIQRGSDKIRQVEMGKTTTEIIQLKSLDAPPRRDEDFLTYYSLAEKNVEDNHCKNKDHPSPFYPRFSLVRGFAIEPMHTAYGGAFFRFLYGLVYVRDEGKLSQNLIALIDARILLFQKCKIIEFDRKLRALSSVNKYKHHELREFLLYYLYAVFKGILSDEMLNTILKLQQGVKLLGGSSTEKVPSNDIAEARKSFKEYNMELMEMKIPIRYMTHAQISK